jgi:hypothetical protein
MVVDNPSGYTQQPGATSPQFHLDLGPNPVDGNIIDGLEPMWVDGRVKANVNPKP